MKTYLLISPQPWGKMYLSKHNYAIELAEAGNKVFFLNPPTYKQGLTKLGMRVKQELPNLFLIDYLLSMPVHVLRFKARPVYDFIIGKSLVSGLNNLAKFDELWCFEPNIFSEFKRFNAKKKLLFLVDQFENTTLKKLAGEADGIASVSSPIMDFFAFSNKPKLLLNHGLNKTFTSLAQKRLQVGLTGVVNQPVKVSYVGNLLLGDRIDYITVQQILQENPAVQFHFYGPYEEKGNTLGSTMSEGLTAFIRFLKQSPNVYLHGIMPQTELALEMQETDAFLICYNYLTDTNKSSNSHKIMEYLSTGKVCVSNRISMYEDRPGLLEMPDEYTNEKLPELFRHVITNLQEYNSPERQKTRIDFALENTYTKHIGSISRFLKSAEAVLQ